MTDPWHITPHAKLQAQQLAVPIVAVVRAATDPEHTSEQTGTGHVGRYVHTRDGIAVVVDKFARIVVAILPSPDAVMIW